MSGYLDLVGYRLLDGFDICEPLCARAARRAAARDPRGRRRRTDDDASEVDARIAEVRSKVPEQHRDQFDELLGEARLTYRLRDERGVFSDIWASGLMRRAALAGRPPGRRRRAGSSNAEHFIDAGFDEMCSLVAGNERAVGRRAGAARRRTAHRAPRRTRRASLGDPPPPPPDPSGLPPDVARRHARDGHRARRAVRQLRGASTRSGCCAGSPPARGVYEGPARRISGPAEFDRIVQGDVLVTESTTEAFNILLPLLGAIVTDSGGLLSHSAIVAREYGIPGVVGTREATERIAGRHARAGRRRRRRGDGARVKRRRRRSPTRTRRALFGSKAVGLGQAARDGLPVPPGVALVGRDRRGGRRRQRALRSSSREHAVRPLGGPLAVRSSAVDEDGADASFAGQHLTLLNVPSADELERGAPRDLVVGELRLGDHLPPARRPVHAAERRRRRAVAARSRRAPG